MVHIFISPCLSLCLFLSCSVVCSSAFPHFLLFSTISTFLCFISPHILNTFFPSLLSLSHIRRHFILYLAPYVICPLITSLYFCSLQQITYNYNTKYVSFFSTLYGLIVYTPLTKIISTMCKTGQDALRTRKPCHNLFIHISNKSVSNKLKNVSMESSKLLCFNGISFCPKSCKLITFPFSIASVVILVVDGPRP